MDNSLFAYIERLELLGFFSGYPLIFAMVVIIAGSREKRNAFQSRMIRILPYAYALTGTLYLGMILRNAYPVYTIDNLFTSLEQPWLRVWGISAILFWIPRFSRKSMVSLLHSLVFFYFIARDLWIYMTSAGTMQDMIRNDMKVYGDSVLIQLSAFVLLITFSFLYTGYRNRSTA